MNRNSHEPIAISSTNCTSRGILCQMNRKLGPALRGWLANQIPQLRHLAQRYIDEETALYELTMLTGLPIDNLKLAIDESEWSAKRLCDIYKQYGYWPISFESILVSKLSTPLDEICEYGCHFDDEYGFVIMGGCPIHD